MARFTVHLPSPIGKRLDAVLEGAVFVRDGWHWGAYLCGPFWLLHHRHWVAGAIVFAAYAAIIGGLSVLAVAPWARIGAIILLQALLALEGSSLRRLALARSGYTEDGVVVGDAVESLEQRYFAERGPVQSATAPALTARSTPIAGAAPTPVIGLFPDSRVRP